MRRLNLTPLPDKSTLTLLRGLLDTIERHGMPKAIRTDNESVFNNPLFDFVLKQFGIRHQTIEKHCPWQNGRVERFFGTLKLDRWSVPDTKALRISLGQFVHWYNEVRPHQHLQGKTPMEAWNGADTRRAVVRRT